MSKQKQPFVPKIGQKVYIKRQKGSFMTVASPHTLETKAKGIGVGGDLF